MLSVPDRSRGVPRPAQIASAAPTTGTLRQAPGNVVASLNSTTAATTAPTPAAAATSLTPIREGDGTNAISAPSPNSHAREKVEKYDTGAAVAVSQML